MKDMEITKDIKCSGCGVLIQTKDKEKEGFVPEHVVLAHDESKPIYCQRCFRIRNYQEYASNDLSGEDYIKVISQINTKDSLIVLIVDIFDFSGSFLPNIKRLTGQNDVILAANKVDLLPSSVNKEKILSWVNELCEDEGLQVLDSILISSKKNIYIDELLELIKKHKKNRDVYIVGSSNVGKSKLVNQIIKRLSGVEKDVLTVSYAPNTTLNFVGFPLEDGTTIYDTPGVLNRHQYLRYLTRTSLKQSIPQKEIKAQIYQLDPEQTLFIGGLARFDFLAGDKCDKSNVALYFSNALPIHRTKLENADRLFEEKRYTLLTPPYSPDEALPRFVKTDFHMRGTGKFDIGISGLGFISVRAPFHIVVHAPVMVGVYLRKAII